LRQRCASFSPGCAAGLLKGLNTESFAKEAAEFLAHLNAIHPFREGNGRTQLTFMTLLAARAGHPFDLSRLDPPEFLQAMITSFFGDLRDLQAILRRLAQNPGAGR
jgi:cell filamentation protein